jgi:hypothetical protein
MRSLHSLVSDELDQKGVDTSYVSEHGSSRGVYDSERTYLRGHQPDSRPINQPCIALITVPPLVTYI